MKTLLEKLKINKDTKPLYKHNFVFVISCSEPYLDMLKDWPDALVYGPTVHYQVGFIIPINKIDTLPKNHKDITIYEIPDTYENIEDFKKDYNNGKIDLHKLNKYQ